MDNVKTVKRRKIIAWTATVVIVLPFVLWCLLPVPTFGYANRLYDAAPQPLELIEGGDLFEIWFCGIVNDWPLFRVVPKKENVSYTGTTAIWAADKRIAPGVCGSVCVMVHGKWQKPEYIGNWSLESPSGQEYYIPPRSEGGGTCGLPFPIYEYSERLRITLYFRECVRSEINGTVTSRGETLSAVFEMDMPKQSRSMFDVLACDFAFSKRGELYIRNNTGEDIQLWLDRDSFLLEKQEESGGYIEVMRGYYESDSPESVPRYERPFTDLEHTMYWYQFELYQKPEPGDYRMTLGFNTEKDGSGDCYTLTLDLRFHEKGSALRD